MSRKTTAQANHNPFPVLKPEIPEFPPTHAAGAIKDLGAAVGSGDPVRINRAKKELAGFGWHLVHRKELEQQERIA